LGFLLGTTLTGYGSYYYLFDEYRAANNVVISDVIKLSQSVEKLTEDLQKLEEKIKKN
jgi:hypothetical protein